ncbi:hypothetical protein HK097_008668 [Rhizophlyctis rosea]|uniref:chitin synthase n=1 Tax=Rhizophlyctis rosea TaxID=64517 RepID=A0AAD5SCS4_9FUNG|nr:hypothetical protein HK097_008668 [Rhizophlyctis rosea]
MRNVGYAAALDEKEDNRFINTDKYPPTIDLNYRETNITICRFPHGGKRQTQAQAYEVAETRHANSEHRSDNRSSRLTVQADQRFSTIARTRDYLFLFLDSDVTIRPDTISNFTQNFRQHPQRTSLTGLILCSPTSSILPTLQETEYVHSQLLTRNLEAVFGGLTCLPGALTMIRCSTLRTVAPLYFGHLRERGKVVDMDVFEYARFYLGEDRYLTHLVMCAGLSRGKVGFEDRAVCETVAVEAIGSLVKQRRRWFLGTVANQVCMLITPRLWRHMPFLLLISLLQSSVVSMSLLQYVFLISLIMEESPAWLILLAFLVPLCLNWICMVVFAVKLRRWKIILYPVLKRTWGGPRVKVGPINKRVISKRYSVGSTKANAGDLDEIITMYSEDYNKEVYISTRHPTALNMVEVSQNRPPSMQFDSSPSRSTTSGASDSTSPSHLSIPPPSLHVGSISTQLSPRTPKSPEAGTDEWWDRLNVSTPVRAEMGQLPSKKSKDRENKVGGSSSVKVGPGRRSSSAWSELYQDLTGSSAKRGEDLTSPADDGDLSGKGARRWL